MEEIWKDVIGYNGQYQISNLARVRSMGFNYLTNNGTNHRCVIKPRILKQRLLFGYCMVGLKLNKKNKTLRVHRLLADVFIPNPENKPFINHKNGIRNDNSIGNLEWCTPLENIQHSFKVLKRAGNRKGIFNTKSSKPVYKICKKTGNVLEEYPSALEASRVTGINPRTIYSALNTKDSKTSYKWSRVKF